MGRLMEICDRVIAEMEASGASPVTLWPVKQAEPRPLRAQSTGITPGPVSSAGRTEPESLRDHPAHNPTPVSLPVRDSIAALLAHCARWGDSTIGAFIQGHPERWRTRNGLPGIADQYSGMVEMMTELHPDQADRIPTEAARMVIAWIEYRDLERISNGEYRDRLAQCWERLRDREPQRERTG